MSIIEMTAPAQVTTVHREPISELVFDLEVGGLRRRSADEMATRLVATGVDVWWTDQRKGVCGRRRRFVVRGPRPVLDDVVSAISLSVGWQPGAVPLTSSVG